MHANIKSRTVSPAATAERCEIPCFKVDLVSRLRKSLPTENALERPLVLLSALADRTRLRLLHALGNGEELCVCDVAHVLGISVSSASHHLRKLRDLKILKYRNDGKMAYYSLRDRFAGKLVGLVVSESGS